MLNVKSAEQIATARTKPTRIELPQPPLGGKCWVLRAKGLFVLEVCPGVLRTIACTHAGAGNLEAIDGVPDADGFFPDEQMEEPSPQPQLPNAIDYFGTPAGLYLDDCEKAKAGHAEAMKAFMRRNGRPLYSANPVVMGSWMLDGGFVHGLTLRVAGGHESSSAIASVVWQPFKQREKAPPA